MSMHVLVIADMEDDDLLALEKARDLSASFASSFEIIKFVHYDSESELAIDEFVVIQEQRLDDNIRAVFDDTTHIQRRIVTREILDEWIVDRCENHHAHIDLVIKSGHRTESLFHTPTDWLLIRHLSCPILIATHTKWKSSPNILMTIDLAHADSLHNRLNEKTLEWGQAWSNATHTQLHALYSIPIARPLLELDIVDKHEVEAKEAPDALKQLTAYLQDHGLLEITCHTPAGPPEKTIPHLAGELHSDLVVMGCVGREGLTGFLFGNTAEKVVHRIRTDCLIIKLPDD